MVAAAAVVALVAVWATAGALAPGREASERSVSEPDVARDGQADVALGSIDRSLPPPETVPVTDVDLTEAVEDMADRGLADHYLFLHGFRGLVGVDGSDGSVTVWEGVTGTLIGRYRDRLLLVDEQQRVVAVPTSDPEGDPLVLTEGTIGQVVQAGVVGGRHLNLAVWDFRGGDGRTRGLTIDLATGALSISELPGMMGEVSWAPGTGVFERSEDGYRLLHSGRPVAVNDRFVLVNDCRGPTDCGHLWIDRGKGSVIERATPPLEDNWHTTIVDDDGRLLALDGRDGRRYFDVENDWYLPKSMPPTSATSGMPTGGPFESDTGEALVGGRLLIHAETNGLRLYDLETREAFRVDLDLPTPVGLHSVLAAPRWSVHPWVTDG